MRRFALFAVVTSLFVAALARDSFDRWVAATDLPPLIPETSVEVRDRNGQLLRAYTVADGLWRLGVALPEVDPDYLAMLIAYEDKRFRDHRGVDPLAMLRAGGQAAWNGHIVSGASTLTMQVARLLEDGSTGAWAGKLRQIRLALALERVLSKDQILELYLTLAPFGGNLEGVRAATLSYFGKEPGRLTKSEAALLVALPQAPEARRPDRDAAAAKAARDRVIARVIDDQDVQRAAWSERAPAAKRPFPLLAPHLADRIRAADPTALRHDLTLSASLQRRLQRLAAQAVRGQAQRLSVAIVVADHRTGAVLAHIGSSGYRADLRQGHVDMTAALRSPGSTLKPLVYGLGFDQALIHPETLILDAPRDYDGYAPQNFDGLFRGDVRIREALQMSLNTAAVALTEAIGPARLMGRLKRAGAQPELPGGTPGLAVALGGVGLTLEDLVRLYGALANDGQSIGLSWQQSPPPHAPRRVLTPEAAWHVADILAGVPPPPGAPRAKVAFKTGTSYGHRDAWAIGFDGAHVVGVWMGRADGTPVPGAFGGDLAAPLLFEVFGHIKPRFDPLPSPPPATLIASSATLPPPLRRFGASSAPNDVPGPELAFPPDGARLERMDMVTLKARDGRAPYTWLVNGQPAGTTRYPEHMIEGLTPGFHRVTVLDGQGRAARTRFELR